MTLEKVILIRAIQTYEGQEANKKLNKDLKETQKNAEATGGSTQNLEKNQDGLNRAQDRGTRSSRDLLMGHLGIMFAGMALNRAMSNLNSTSREWVGTGEIMSTTMGVVMLPAALALLETGVLPLSEALLGMSEPTQIAIAGFSTLTEAAGGAMMIFGQFMLGMNSMMILMPKLFAAIGGVKGALMGLAGLGVISIGVVLGIESVTAEGGKSVLYALGSAIAIGLGAVLLGATALGGIVVGGVVLAVIATIKMTIDDIEYAEDLQERMQNKLYETATPSEQVLRGFSPTGGQGTMVNFGNEYGQRDALMDEMGLDNFVLNPGMLESSSSGSGLVFNLNTTNNIEVADLQQFGTIVDEKNQMLVDNIRSGY